MGFNKKFYQTGGLVASTPPSGGGAFDPLQNFETVTYTGNGGTQKITGYIRKGAAFNGSSSKISIPHQTWFDNDFTVSLWFNATDDTGSGVQTLFNKRNTGDSTSPISIVYQEASSGFPNTVRFSLGGGISGNIKTYLYSTNTANINEWNFVVVKISGTAMSLTLNGVESTGTFSGTRQTNTVPIRIGIDYGYGTNDSPFSGLIDQIRIFNTALNQTQIDQLALETYADPKKSTTDYFGDGSGVALYELDDNSLSSNFKQAAVFSGTNYITTPTLPDYRSGFAFSSWVLSDTTQNKFIITQKGTGEYANFAYRLINGKINLITGNGTSAYYINYTHSTALTNGWHNIVVTGTASSISIYVDGAFLTTQTGTAFLNSSNMEHIMGVNYYNGAIDTVGAGAFLLDQFRFFNTALGQEDVTKLYQESSTIPTANLVAHYKLDGDATDALDTYNGVATAVTYSNGVYGGTATNVNYLGMAFQPDLVWVKSRSQAYGHYLHDSVRGVTKILNSNEVYNEGTITNGVTSFDANGFSIGNSIAYNVSSQTYVAWCWKAADITTTILAGTVGNTIASDVRANTEAGFSIVKYNTSNSSFQTVGHGLSSTPELIITKSLDISQDWSVNTSVIDGSWDYGYLNLTDQFNNSSLTAPTSAVFTTGGTSQTSDFIAYCFHSVAGYQKAGSYTGTGLAGNFVSTSVDGDAGFEPRWIMVKAYDTPEPWFILDSNRDPSNPRDNRLMADSYASESDGSVHTMDFNSNGFTLNGTVGNGTNGSGFNYIYLAIA